MKTTVTLSSEMTSRVRSSPRCSTSVASSPWRRRRGRSLIALRVALGRGRNRVLRLSLGCRRQLWRLVLVLAGDRVLELAHALAERASHLGQPLRAEDEEDDYKQNR